MKIKKGYCVKKVADSGVVIATEEMDCNHLMTLNQSGISLWDLMQQETDIDTLVKEMLAIYDIDEETLRKDIEAFISKVREAELLDE